MPDIRVLRERCVACGDCVELCPQSGADVTSPVLSVDEDGDVWVSSSQGCIGCFTCVEYCRAAAIVITGAAQGAAPDAGLYPMRPLNRII